MTTIQNSGKVIRWVLAIEVLRRIGRLLIIPILAKYFGAINYGIWAQIGVTVELLTILAGLELPSAVGRFIPGTEKIKQKEYVWSCASTSILSALIITIIPIFLRNSIAKLFFGGEQNSIYVVLGCILVVVNVNLKIVYSFFRSLLLVKTTFFLLLLEVTLTASLFLMAAQLKQNLTAIVLFDISIRLLLVAISYFIIIKTFGFALPSFKDFYPLLKYSLPLIPTMALHWIYNSSDRYLLSLFNHFNELGVYAIGYTIAYLPIGFIFSIIFYIIPGIVYKKWNEGMEDSAVNLLVLFMKFSSIFSVLLLFNTYIARKFIILTFSTEQFSHAESIILPIGLGYFILFTGDYFTSLLNIVKKTVYFPITYSFAAACNIILNILWIPKWGIEGAAWATFCAMCLLSFINFFMSRRYIKRNFPIHLVPLLVILSLGLYFIIDKIDIINLNFLNIFLKLSLFSSLYLLFCFTVKIINISDIKLLIQFIFKTNSILSHERP